MANNVDPDQMPHSAASDLGLHCLQIPTCPTTWGYYGTLKTFSGDIVTWLVFNNLNVIKLFCIVVAHTSNKIAFSLLNIYL